MCGTLSIQRAGSDSSGRFVSVYLVFLILPALLLTNPLWGQGMEVVEAQRQELSRAASLAGTPLQFDPRIGNRDFNEEWTRLLPLYEQRNWVIRDPQLASAWSNVEQSTLKCLQILYAIAQIDKNKPQGWDIFIKSLNSN